MPTDSSQVYYTGPATPHIPIAANQTLEAILQNIDTKFNDIDAAPDYTSFDLACIVQIDGESAITDTQEFAEGISKIVCDHLTAYDTFVGTTYVSDQAVITEAINGIVNPELVYAPFSITDADSLNGVFGKLFTGFTAYNTALNPSTAGWSTLGISPSPTTVTNGFAALITHIDGLVDDIADKQDILDVFDNTSNYLDGGATDDVATTLELLINYVDENVPAFVAGDITTTCLSEQTDLQDWIQHIVDTAESIITDYVSAAGAGLTLTAGSSCAGKSLAINTSWEGLYKVRLESADSTQGFLEDKIIAGTGITLNQVSDGGFSKIEIVNSSPDLGKATVNEADTHPGYLANKIPSVVGTWGLAIEQSVSATSGQLILTPVVVNPAQLVYNLMSYISSDPGALAQWCALQEQCEGCSCDAPTSLVVTIASSDFRLTWSIGGTPTSQIAKYRVRGNVDWITNANIDPANPLSDDVTTVDIDLSRASNTVYEFQVDSNCSGINNGSNIKEAILFDDKELVIEETARVVTVSQSAMISVDTIEYVICVAASEAPVETVMATGTNPTAVFAALSAGTYFIKWRMGATVNGITLYSDDASQAGAYYQSDDIVIS